MEPIEVFSRLSEMSCMVVFLVYGIYLMRQVLPLIQQIMDSHERRVERLMQLIETIDKNSK